MIEEKGVLSKNPTRGIDLPTMQMLASRQLLEDQRFILRLLVEQEGDRRGTALFALDSQEQGCMLNRKGNMLYALDRYEEAVNVYNEAISYNQ